MTDGREWRENDEAEAEAMMTTTTNEAHKQTRSRQSVSSAESRSSPLHSEHASSSENISAIEAARLNEADSLARDLAAVVASTSSQTLTTAAVATRDERPSPNEAAISAASPLSEWQRYTSDESAPPPSSSPPRRNDERLLGDEILAHAFDNYDERREASEEAAAAAATTGCRPFGPPTFETHVRRAFCRVLRHNERARRRNQPNFASTDFIFDRILGQGTFSTVVRGLRVDSDEAYAIKVIEKRKIVRQRQVQYISREKDILATLTFGHGGHPFVAAITCTFEDVDRICTFAFHFFLFATPPIAADFVLSYAHNGELLTWLRRLGSFDRQVCQFYASELVSAMEYLHEQCGVVHRDRKCRISLDVFMPQLANDKQAATAAAIRLFSQTGKYSAQSRLAYFNCGFWLGKSPRL